MMNKIYTMTVKKLLKVNKNSKLKNYNRTFDTAQFLESVQLENSVSSSRALSIKVVMEFAMEHRHAHGQPVSPHARVILNYSRDSRIIFDLSYGDLHTYAKRLPLCA